MDHTLEGPIKQHPEPGDRQNEVCGESCLC
jgi:hypothetical protein